MKKLAHFTSVWRILLLLTTTESHGGITDTVSTSFRRLYEVRTMKHADSRLHPCICNCDKTANNWVTVSNSIVPSQLLSRFGTDWHDIIDTWQSTNGDPRSTDHFLFSFLCELRRFASAWAALILPDPACQTDAKSGDGIVGSHGLFGL